MLKGAAQPLTLLSMPCSLQFSLFDARCSIEICFQLCEVISCQKHPWEDVNCAWHPAVC